jgi:Probable cobalt transporter subunit (CbtA)
MVVGVYRRFKQAEQSASAIPFPCVLAVTVYAVYVTVVDYAMPNNPDPVTLPAEVVWPFRVIAFLGLLLLWTVLGGAFAWLLQSEGKHRTDHGAGARR